MGFSLTKTEMERRHIAESKYEALHEKITKEKLKNSKKDGL
jgi:hypothetical protein